MQLPRPTTRFGGPLSAPIGALVLLLTILVATLSSVAAQTAEEAPIQIEKIEITPDTAGPETLCQLWLTLRNSGPHHASAFQFEVLVGGHPLPVYSNHRFLTPVAPGETKRIRLFNFWSSETSRPYPSEGDLQIILSIEHASWWSLSKEEGETTWTLVGDVEQRSPKATATIQRPS